MYLRDFTEKCFFYSLYKSLHSHEIKFLLTECSIFESKTYANIQEFNIVDFLTETNISKESLGCGYISRPLFLQMHSTQGETEHRYLNLDQKSVRLCVGQQLTCFLKMLRAAFLSLRKWLSHYLWYLDMVVSSVQFLARVVKADLVWLCRMQSLCPAVYFWSLVFC